MRQVLWIVAEHSSAVRLFVNPFPPIHVTFVDTKRNLSKNSYIPGMSVACRGDSRNLLL
jgi:hypothetical protein